MLVLARRLNESIIIGDEIEVVVIGHQGRQVKLGIKAPKKISVHRKEIYEEIHRENIAALKSEFKPSAARPLRSLRGRGGKKKPGEGGKEDPPRDDHK
jgi:carbon storage regulator